MKKESMMEAQDFLTAERMDGSKYKVIDLQSLLQRRNMDKVIQFLKDYRREKEKALKNMILIDKTHPKVDQYVAALFRMAMAIKTLEEGEEVKIIERPKQGAEESGKLHQWDSSSHSSAGIRKNQDHDGKDRVSGHETKRAA